MKLNPIESTLTAVGDTQTITSRVNAKGARRIAAILVNMYSDPILATIREYIANAIDATRAAGSTTPVNVIPPTAMEPNFIVTDQGIGMNMADVEAAYLAFAESTKEDSNDQVGGLGIGAKSAWTLAESFLIATVKDGKQTIVRASRELEHQVIMADEPTDLPNGTTITIPVDLDGNEEKWATLIQQVTEAHDPGMVKINGKLVVSIAGGPNKIGPIIAHRIDESSYSDSVYIRSGGTLFEAGRDISYMVKRKVDLRGCVIELPIGSFDHTPSREALTASTRTKAAIEKALGEYKVAYQDVAARIHLLAKTDITAAVKLRTEIVGNVGAYDVLPIRLNFQVPGGIGASHNGGRKWKKTVDTKTGSESEGTDFFSATSLDDTFRRTVMVTGIPAGRVLRTFARYLKENHMNATRILPLYEGETAVEVRLTENSGKVVEGQILRIEPSMLPEGNVYTWDRFREVTAPDSSGPRGPVAGYTCRVTTVDGTDPVDRELTVAQILALSLPVWYVDEIPQYRTMIAKKASVGVVLGRRKQEALQKAIPDAMSLWAWHTEVFEATTSTWSEGEKLALVADGSRFVHKLKLAAQARDKRAAAGKSINTVLNFSAQIVAAVGKLTDQQKSDYQTMTNAYRGASGLSDFSAKLDKLDKQLHKSWPLLKEASGYNGIDLADQWIEYLVAVEPRQPAAQ